MIPLDTGWGKQKTGRDHAGATELPFSDTDALLRLARAARAAGDRGSAVDLYREALEKRPADMALTVEFGDALVEAGLLDDAIGVYGQVDAASPSRARALSGLARTYLKLAEPDKALPYAHQAAGLAPQDDSVVVDEGVVMDQVGRHAEAQQAYRSVIARSPMSVAARNDLALSLAMTGQFDEAISIMTPMVRSANATARLRQNLALIYGLKGDRDEALALGRVDLDEAAAQANLQFFDYVRAPAK